MTKAQDIMVWSVGLAALILVVWGGNSFISYIRHRSDLDIMVNQLEEALHGYYSTHGEYPDALPELGIDLSGEDKNAFECNYKSFGDSFTFEVYNEDVRIAGREGEKAEFFVTNVKSSK